MIYNIHLLVFLVVDFVDAFLLPSLVLDASLRVRVTGSSSLSSPASDDSELIGDIPPVISSSERFAVFFAIFLPEHIVCIIEIEHHII